MQSVVAGRDADIVLQDTIVEATAAAVQTVKVLLFNAAGNYATTPLLPQPDRQPTRGRLHPAVRPAPAAGCTPATSVPTAPACRPAAARSVRARNTIDSTVTFNAIAGGRDIQIVHATNPATGAFGSVMAINAQTDVDTDGDGDGKVDVFTNGPIVVTEANGDLRVGAIVSTGGNVTLTSPARILDAESGTGVLGTDPTPTDVSGVNITMTAGTGTEFGGIGLKANFLEIDFDRNGVRGTITGRLTATDVAALTSSEGIFLTETAGDLNVARVHTVLGDVTLRTIVGTGSIVDANNDAAADVIGNSITLDANGADADIGAANGTNDLDIDSSVSTPGTVTLQAGRHIDVTEVDGGAAPRARPRRGRPRATSRSTTRSMPTRTCSSTPGTALFTENTVTTIPVGLVDAALDVELAVGDSLIAGADTAIRAGTSITIWLDDTNADPGLGTDSLLGGEITADRANTGNIPLNVTTIFANVDTDRITFDHTVLGSRTLTFGGPDTSGLTGAPDGDDLFLIDHLAGMDTARGHTLLLDGGSRQRHVRGGHARVGRRRRRLRHRRARLRGARQRQRHPAGLGADSPLDGIDPLTGVAYPSDDVFLLRRAAAIVCAGPAGTCANEATAVAPAFVAVLHGDAATVRPDPALGPVTTGSYPVERINYDRAINGRLIVDGAGGNDLFAVDDVTAPTALDGGAGDDGFQFGQLYGTPRQSPAVADPDAFPTMPTVAGYVSNGNSAPTTVTGGSGADSFTVYANQAPAHHRRRRRQRPLRGAGDRHRGDQPRRVDRHRRQRRRRARHARGRHDPWPDRAARRGR